MSSSYKIGKGDRILDVNKQIIQCSKLDTVETFCRTFEFDKKVKFIKMDVQGFEMNVLKGGENFINEHRPVMVIEFEDGCTSLYGYTSKELFEHIKNLNYEIYFLYHDYPCDHICVPLEKVAEFETMYEGKIHPHSENNEINNNFKHGIYKKLVL